MLALQRIWAVSSKELRQLSRDRGTFAMVVMIPIIELLMFGYAINTDVRGLRGAVVDHSQSSFSREIISSVQATQVINIVDHVATVAELELLIRKGQVSVGLVIPEDAARRQQQTNRNIAQLLVDGSDPVIAGVVAKLGSMRFDGPALAGQGRAEQAFAIHIFYNPEKRSTVYIVPGLIGVILTMTMVLFTSLAIVREKEQGTMELLIATPLSTMQLMVGKVIPYIGIGLIQMSLIVGLGYWVFKVPVNGSLVDIVVACLLFIAANLTLGLLISTLAATQLQAMQITLFILMPSILLSGFMFPFDGMPELARWLAELLPLTHFLRIIRGLILRGAELGDIIQEVYSLMLFALATLSLAALRFKKRLD